MENVIYTEAMGQAQEKKQPANVILIEEKAQKNNIGLAGFILSLVGLIPGIGWVVWFLGVLFSFIGLFKRPRTFAVIGMCISFIGLILLISAIGIIGLLL